MFNVVKYKPKLLSKYIACYKVYHFAEAKEVALDPEGYFEMIFQLENDFLHNTAMTEGWELRPQNFVGGLHTKSYRIKPTVSNTKIFGIEFKSNGAKHFIPDKLQLYKNRTVNLNDVMADMAGEAIGQNAMQGMSEGNISIIENCLAKAYREQKFSAIDKALEMMENRKGFINIEELAKRVSLSSAQFRKRFNEEVGMSPKEYCKIIRFKTVTDQMKQQPNMKLTDLSYQLGYFDQSHFIKDFQSVARKSPKKYRVG